MQWNRPVRLAVCGLAVIVSLYAFQRPFREFPGVEYSVGEMALPGARPDTHQLGGALNGPASSDEGSEDVHLALGRGPRSGSGRLLARAQHLSGALLQQFMAGCP